MGLCGMLEEWMKGSAAPLVANTPATTDAPAAADAGSPQDIKGQIPRWLPTVGNPKSDLNVPRQTHTKKEK